MVDAKNGAAANAGKKMSVDAYLAGQNRNVVTRYLHSIRYHHLTRFLEQAVATRGGASGGRTKMKVFEIGCGFGKSLGVIEEQPGIELVSYLGIDVEQGFVSHCQERCAKPGREFLLADVRDYAAGAKRIPFEPDCVIALECFEHIDEYTVPKVIDWIATLKCPLFVTVPNEVGPAILVKNVGAYSMGYPRYKEYTWPETMSAALGRLDRVPPHGTGHRGFDWHWLAAVLNQRFAISKIGTSPWDFIPRNLSPSINFYCEPRGA